MKTFAPSPLTFKQQVWPEVLPNSLGSSSSFAPVQEQTDVLWLPWLIKGISSQHHWPKRGHQPLLTIKDCTPLMPLLHRDLHSVYQGCLWQEIQCEDHFRFTGWAVIYPLRRLPSCRKHQTLTRCKEMWDVSISPTLQKGLSALSPLSMAVSGHFVTIVAWVVVYSYYWTQLVGFSLQPFEMLQAFKDTYVGLAEITLELVQQTTTLQKT